MNPISQQTQARDYAGLLLRIAPLETRRNQDPREPRRHPSGMGDETARMAGMRRVVDLCWEVLSPRGISWIGFYLKDPAAEQLVLGPRRDKPACSPIGLHGMCGRSFLERRSIIVRDVADLGKDYIACDPRDRSEVVIPLLEADGSCWGVLDADSYERGAFSEADAAGLTALLEAAGLSAHPAERLSPVLL